MAEGYLRSLLGDKAEVVSAGTQQHGLNPRVVKVMAEDGIDIEHHTSKLVDSVVGEPFDLVFTVCDYAKEVCPVLPGNAKYVHENFHDPTTVQGPETTIMDAFRTTRDAIRKYCEWLVSNMDLH